MVLIRVFVKLAKNHLMKLIEENFRVLPGLPFDRLRHHRRRRF